MLNPHRTRFGDVNFWLIYTSWFIFYVKADQARVPADLSPFAIQKGRDVFSIVRPWEESKELFALSKVATANRTAFRPPARS